MNANNLYSLFMWIGAIGTFLVLTGFIGAWITSSAIGKKSTEKIAELHLEIESQKSILVEKENQIDSLEKDLDLIKKYEWLSGLDMFARPIRSDGSIKIDTDLTNAFEGYYTMNKNNTTTFRVNPDAINKYNEIVKKYSKFPLPHYVLSIALFKTGDNNWQKEAEIAIEMIENITKIPEHHGWYDDALKELDALIKKEKKLPNQP